MTLYTTGGCTIYMYVLLVSTIPKFQSVSLYGQLFSTYGPFWEKCTKWPKMTLNSARSKVPHICAIILSLSPKFQTISLYDQPFWSYRLFWDKGTKGPQTDLGHYKVKGILWLMSPKSQTSIRFPLQPAVWSYRHFKTSGPNDLNIEHYLLNITRSKVHHICVTSVPKSLISLGFALRPTVLEQAILSETSALNDQKYHWIAQGQRYPIYAPSPHMWYLCPRVSNVSPFRFTASVFELQARHQMTPKWPWILQCQSSTIYVLLVSVSPKFTPFHSMICSFGVKC